MGKRDKKAKKNATRLDTVLGGLGADCECLDPDPSGGVNVKVDPESYFQTKNVDTDHLLHRLLQNLKDRCAEASMEEDADQLLQACSEIGAQAVSIKSTAYRAKDLYQSMLRRMNCVPTEDSSPNGEASQRTTG